MADEEQQIPTIDEVLTALETWRARDDKLTQVIADVQADDAIDENDKSIAICERLELPVLPVEWEPLAGELIDGELVSYDDKWRCQRCRLVIDNDERPAHDLWHRRMVSTNALTAYVTGLVSTGSKLTGSMLAAILNELLPEE